MEYRVLGPLEVRDSGQSLPLGGAKQRALLALLLLNANDVVSVDRLLNELWGDSAPASAVPSVHVYVSRLRRTLGPGRIETRPPGYLIRVAAGELDLDRFDELVAAGDGDSLREALGLWQGEPLADFAYEAFAQGPIARLRELRLAALERRIAADLEQSDAAGLIAEIDELVRQNPLRERLRALQLLALYRAGRQSDALAAYRDARNLLTEELGLEPSEELQRLEKQILTHDPALDPARLASGDEPPDAEPAPGTGLRGSPQARDDPVLRRRHRRRARGRPRPGRLAAPRGALLAAGGRGGRPSRRHARQRRWRGGHGRLRGAGDSRGRRAAGSASSGRDP